MSSNIDFKPANDGIDFQPSGQNGQAALYIAVPNPKGMIAPGNIDIAHRPSVPNPITGGYSSIWSMSIGTDKGEVLIPRVSPDGKILSEKQAINLYRQTGQNLGTFDSIPAANAYAETLHEQQARTIPAPSSDDIDFRPAGRNAQTDTSLLPPRQAAASVPYPANPIRDLWDTLKEKAGEAYNSALGYAQKVNDVLNYPSIKAYEQLTHPSPGVDISKRPGVKTVVGLVAGSVDPRNLPFMLIGQPEVSPLVRGLAGAALGGLQSFQAYKNVAQKQYGQAAVNAALATLGLASAGVEGLKGLSKLTGETSEAGQRTSGIDFQPHSVGSAASNDLDQTIGTAGLAKTIAPEGAPNVVTTKEALPTIKAIGQKLSGTLKAIQDLVNEKPKAHGIHGAVDRFSGLIQKSRFGARQFRNAILQAVPDQLTRQGITNWIEAGGDADVLKQRMADVPDQFKPQFQAALNLTDDQKTIARNIENFFGEKLQTGQEAGLLQTGRENYVPHAWEQNEQAAIKTGGGKLSTYLPNARQRVFANFAEGMKAGYIPVTTDVAEIIPEYDRVFTRALASRKFVQWLSSNKASDERPLVVKTGGGSPATEEGGPVLTNPDVRPEDVQDYRVLNNSALKGWKFAAKGPLGVPVMVKGDLAVHPEIAGKLENLIDQRGLGSNPDYLPAKLFKSYQQLGSQIKGSMFSFSPFHAVNVGGIAESLRVNPFNPAHIDVNDPLTGELLDHGLTLGTEHMSEGFSSQGAPWVQRIPVVGPLQRRFEQWMFGPDGYLSRIKVAVGKALIDRNAKLYGDKLDRDQIVKLSATESNNAVGGQNLDSMFRSRKFQDGLRAVFLAPDFLESRLRFNLGALGKYGGAQRQALALDFAQRYVLARVLNQVINGNPQYDLPFGVKIGKKEYSMRSNIGDLFNMVGSTANVFDKSGHPTWYSYRLNPLTRGLTEMVYHRGPFGRPESTAQAAVKTAETMIPISLQGLAGIGRDPSLAESVGNAVGIHDYVYRSPAEKVLHDAVLENIPPQAFTHKSPMGKAVNYIRNGDVQSARQMVKDGKLSAEQFRRALKIGRESPLVEDAKEAPIDALVQAYAKATPDEQKVLKPILLRRAATAERRKPFNQAQKLRQKVEQLAKR